MANQSAPPSLASGLNSSLKLNADTSFLLKNRNVDAEGGISCPSGTLAATEKLKPGGLAKVPSFPALNAPGFQQHKQQEQELQQLPPESGSSCDTVTLTPGNGLEEENAAGLPLPPVDSETYRWIGVRHRTRNLCQVFGLPDPKEDLLSDFHAALRKRVLLQGRVYVFANYICFTSNPFFGYIKKTVIPLQKVKSVRKKTHCRLPNSIEIELLSGKKEFFTNLLSRQDAYDIILRCWARIRPLESLQQQQEQQQQQQHQSCPTSTHSLRAPGPNDSYAAGPSTQKTVSYAKNLDGLDGSGPPSKGPVQNASSVALGKHQPSAASLVSILSRSNSLLNDRATLASEGGSVDEEEEEEEEEEGGNNTVYGLVESKPPPPKAPDARLVLNTVIPGTPASLYNVLLATKSHFMEDFLESEGNRRINLTPWKRHHQLAHVRDVSFVAPIRGAFGNWGVSHTQCFQSHRFCRHAGDHLVFESSQTMNDIPYGDCFTVDIRWDITPTTIPEEGSGPEGSPGLNIDIVVRIPFQRSCLFKKVIESGTQKQVLQTYTAMVDALKPALLEALQPTHLPLEAEVEPGPKGRESMRSMGSGGVQLRNAGAVGPGSTPAAKEEPSHITVSDGKAQVAVPTTSSLISPTVLDYLHAEAATRARHVGSYSSSFICSIGRAVRSWVFSLNDLLMGLVGCSMNPQLMWLTILVSCTFAFQLFFFIASWGAGRGSGLTHWGLQLPQPHAAPPFMSCAAGGSLPLTPKQFWAQRLELLQMEVNLLERRMRLVEEEAAFVSVQHQQALEAEEGAVVQ